MPTKKKDAPLKRGTPNQMWKAYRTLSGYHTHDALTGDEAEPIAKAFGLRFRGWKIKANTRDPKGLFVPGLPPNTVVERVAAFDLAELIASHLGLQYARKLGRGSQGMACLEAIEKFLLALEAPADA
ncbi:MAG TPA: hypothetical protein PK788_09200 [Gemmatimonadaceae bacterium]|nr:hypothetical protein [Gemmatimonadaceae bacterium]